MLRTVLAAVALSYCVSGTNAFVGPGMQGLRIQGARSSAMMPATVRPRAAPVAMLSAGGTGEGKRVGSLISMSVAAGQFQPSDSGSSPMGPVINQVAKLFKAVPSLAVFIALNYGMTSLFKHFGLKSVPPPLVGMFLLFATLLALPEQGSAKVVAFFKPGVDMLSRFLPLFFSPALIVLPLAASAISGPDAAKTLGVIIVTLIFSYVSTASITVALQAIAPPKAAVADASTPLPGFSALLESLFALTVLVSGAAALASPQATPAFMLLSSVFAFIFGSRIPRVLPPALATVCHPLVSTYIMATLLFSSFAAVAGTSLTAMLKAYFIAGGGVLSAPGNLILYGLGPAIWSFAFGLYGRRKILFANLIPILGGTVWAAVGGLYGVAAISRFFAPSEILKLAVLPRATAALAVVQAGMIGSNPSLVTAVCCLVGMLSANFGKIIFAAMGCKSACARGVATGGSGFALGAASLAKDDPEAFPFGALSMALMSTWATLLLSVPSFRESVLNVADINKAPISASAKSNVDAPSQATTKVVKGNKVAFMLPGTTNEAA